MNTATDDTLPWMNNTNVYEVNIRQYTKAGTLQSFIPHLSRLRNMGVETLWFMPLTPISQKRKKGSLGSYYACSDYCSINPEFGSLDDFKELVTKAHAMGFKVILDWVANHTGWDHTWTHQHPDFYKKEEHTGSFKTAPGMDDIIELDFSNPHLRKAMIVAMAFWIRECNIDGFRCDLAFWVQADFWVEAKNELQKIKPLFWLGEFDMLDHPMYLTVFNASYTWAWMHATEKFYKSEGVSLEDLKKILHRYISFLPKLPAWFTSNHDENSWNGTEFDKYGKMALLLQVFSLTFPGIPILYSGQEIPNTRQLNFFDKDELDWSRGCQLEDFFKKFLILRKENKACRTDQNSAILILDTGHIPILAYIREQDENKLFVVLNCSGQSQEFIPVIKKEYGLFSNIWIREEIPVTPGTRFKMNPWEYRVYQQIPA